jgi:hypothetical protein
MEFGLDIEPNQTILADGAHTIGRLNYNGDSAGIA